MSACALVLAAEAQERGAEAELRALRNHLAPAAADDGAEHRAGDLADFVFGRLARLRRAVAQQHVTELVRHHARDFAVGVRRLDHPAVDEHRSAGQRERVDLPHVHDFEGVLEFGMPQVRGNGGRPGAGRCPARTTSRRRRASAAAVLRASAAALRPSSTSCAGVYLLSGGDDARLRAGERGGKRERDDGYAPCRDGVRCVGFIGRAAANKDPERFQLAVELVSRRIR